MKVYILYGWLIILFFVFMAIIGTIGANINFHEITIGVFAPINLFLGITKISTFNCCHFFIPF